MATFIKALLDVSITASYLAAAVILLRLVLKKAPKFLTVLLWGLVALRLIVPVFPESSLSVIPDTAPITNSVTEGKEPAVTPPMAEEEDTVTVPPAPEEGGVEEDEETITTPPLQTTPAEPTVPETPATAEKEGGNPWTTVFWIWLAGFCLMLIYALISWLRVLRSVKGSVKEDGRIRISGGTSTPFILGFAMPRIYLPKGLSDEDRLYVMAHEKAHIKRGDHLWKPFGFLLLSLHWFNPLLWVSYILLCRDIELATDEKAIKKLGEEHKKPYSHTLISCAANRALIAACPLAFGETGVKNRIKRVLNYKRPAFWIIIVAIIACIVTSVLFLTNPKDNKPETIGTWYGSGIYIGETYRFDEDGKGLYVNCYGEETAFLWKIENDELFIEEKDPKTDKSVFHAPYGYKLKEDTLELYHKCDCPSISLSKSKWSYGGESGLIRDVAWTNSGKTMTLLFNEDGTVSHTTNGNTKSYNWLYNKLHKVLMFADGDEIVYRYSCRIYEDYLEIGLDFDDNFVFKLEPLSSAESEDDSSAETLSENGWTLDGDTVTISGEGEMSAPPSWDSYKGRIKTVVIEKGVTSISAKAFSGCTSLESVTIPDTVTAIYHLAFEGCTSLESISLPSSITTIQELAFSGCTSLTVMHLPNDLHTLNGNIFDGCTSLEQIFLPINMVNVCAPVFANCPALKELSLSSYNENFRLIGNTLFNKDTLICYVKSEDDGWDGYSLPDITKYVGKSAFANCKDLRRIDINEGVVRIESDAFSGCTALEEISIPDSVTQIGKNAFYGCTALKSLNLSEGITLIDDGAFYGTALEEILFPDSVTEIGEQAFGDCDSLYSVVLPPKLKHVEGTMFDGCNRLRNITLPENVSSISAPAFANCPSLKELNLSSDNEKLIFRDGVLFQKNGDTVRLLYCPKDKKGEYNIPSGIFTISEGAFWNCVLLTKVSFPEGIDIARIPDKMFMGCVSLKEVAFASDLENLEGNVFYGCSAFESVRYGGTVEEWNAVRKHPYWRGEDVQTVKQVICKDGTIKIEPYTQFWTLDENGTFTLLFDGGDAYTPLWEDIKPKIKKVIIKDGVTKIPSNAFDECVNLKSVTIPDSVTSMNGGGFSGCTSLKEITLPDGIKVVGDFSRCTSLEKVKLPAKLESLGQYAFSGCTSLKSITLPDTLNAVAARAFFNCTALESVHIPDSVTEIGLEAFGGCSSLKTVTGGKNVKKVAYAAFAGSGITDAELLKNATEVGESAFADCAGLKSAVLAEGVSIIKLGTFSSSGLETVSIPKSVKMIRSLAFSSCGKLKTVVYGGTVAEWNEITLDVQWLGEDFSATVTVKCTDGTLTAKNVEGMVDYGP